MTEPSQTSGLATEWQSARLLYPLYVALAREFVIECAQYPDLETDAQSPEQESVESARRWFVEMDGRIQIHQLRQFLQTTTLCDDECLRALLVHHLRKPEHTDSDRDKTDFLLVQFFSHGAPSRLQDADVDLPYVAQLLEPALGKIDLTIPDGLHLLDELIAQANTCQSLSDLLTGRILDQGRKLKVSAGEAYFVPAAMVAFTRFSFLMRRVFFRLMHQDLNAILDGLRELGNRGVGTLDCRRAQFSAQEPVARLRMICQSWKVMFHAEYSSGQPLSMLVDLRAAVEAALAQTSPIAPPADAQPASARAAAAGVSSTASASQVSEFDVSTSSGEWNSDNPDQP
jgi:hypothetical protein